MGSILCFREMIFIVVWRTDRRALKQDQEVQVFIFAVAITLGKRSAGLVT